MDRDNTGNSLQWVQSNRHLCALLCVAMNIRYASVNKIAHRFGQSMVNLGTSACGLRDGHIWISAVIPCA